MGILDLLNGMGQADAAPWMDRLMTSGAGQGGGGGGQGGLLDMLKQLQPPQAGPPAGGGMGQPPQGGQPGSQSADLASLIAAYLQQQRR